MHVGESLEHSVTHVGEDEALAAQTCPSLNQGLVVEMELDLLLKEIGLTDEKIRSGGCLDQRVSLLGIA